jgi:capsular polysaccharide biosynthesis protein
MSPEEPRAKPTESVPLATALLRGVPIALLCGVLCAALAYGLSSRQAERYEASSLLLLRPVGASLISTGASGARQEGQGGATTALLVASRDVLRRVAQRENVTLDADELRGAVKVEPLSNTDVVRVTATTGSAEEAAAVANGVAREYVSLRRAQTRARARAAREALRRQYEALPETQQESQAGLQLQQRIDELRVLQSVGGDDPELAESAVVPAAPMAPKPRRDALLGGLFGLLLGAGLATLRLTADRRVRRPQDIERALDAPVLASVRRVRVGKGAAPGMLLSGRDSEALALLHARLRHRSRHRDIRSIAVMPMSEGDEDSVLAWRLSAVAAAAGERVLLLAGDERSSQVARRLGIGHGLSEALGARTPLAAAARHVSLDGGAPDAPGFDVLAGGGDSSLSAERRGERIAELVEQAESGWDLTVVSTASVLSSASAVPAVAHTDGVLLVGRLARADADRARAVRDQLDAMSAPLIGVVLERR